MPNKRLIMVIDLKRCVGCHTCALACKLENNLPAGIWWNRVLTVGDNKLDTPAGVYPFLDLEYMTLACQHCENPPCVRVCPVEATYKRQEDGVVMQDYDRCIGCRYCMVACPYTGVRQCNWESPKYSLDFPVGDSRVPVHQKGVVGKCVFCFHRLDRGLSPACIEVCPAHARHFDDLKEAVGFVSQLLRHRSNFQLLADKGTHPSVYFLT